MKTLWNKSKALFFLVAVLFLTGVGGTIAYYYTQVIIPNEFITKTYNVTLEEEFENKFGTKSVTIKNVDATNVDVVLRINYNERWYNDDGDVLSNTVNGTNVVNKTWTNAFLNDFEKMSDGWYYYKKVLGPEESVQVLESIAKNTEAIALSSEKELYDTYHYDLSFHYEAIQAEEQAVKNIWNKIITIEGSDITW